MPPAGTLRPVLGDQISDDRLSSLIDLDPARDVVQFAEMRAPDREDIRAQAEKWRERFGATPL